ncbi:glycosyltransferase family 4 protein [Neptuniibacter sp. QD57_21]|uniref:glycosyltransferase family 4 protein n=1 Tax=Neptuniibacter sp. QD57_21 TaxID=3398213 RepID=UPI0039F538F5
MKKSILIIGPFPDPLHGCSLANEVLKRGLLKREYAVEIIDMATSLSEDIGSFSFKKAAYALKNYLSIYKVFRADIIYLTPGQSFLGIVKYSLFILAARMLGKEIVFHVHGNYLWQEYEKSNGIKKKLIKFLIGSSSKGIVLSPSLEKNLSPFLPRSKIFSVFNFAENYLHAPSITKKFDRLRVVYLSNLMTEKGIFDLLEALRLLKSKGVYFEAKLAGGIDPNIADRVFENIQELGCNVRYLGLVKGIEKKELLTWGNVFVFPTYYRSEGQPIALLEAMTTGNSIITTKHAGIPDILCDQNAFFVDIKSPEQINETLQKFEHNRKEFILKSDFNLHEAAKYTEDHYVYSILEVVNAK